MSSSLKVRKNSALQSIGSKEAQATVEYILILAISVGLFVLVSRTFLKPFFSQLSQALGNRLERSIGGPNFHSFPVGGRRRASSE